ncbi:hypothetical protein FJTKL_05000 [Diaporthe vaccinii]|uniref:Uncharacterized protein n=1 Tax=Diaporthe vaccinii TaxID=105482 RepID=A0ABR4EYS5_9PEZI
MAGAASAGKAQPSQPAQQAQPAHAPPRPICDQQAGKASKQAPPPSTSTSYLHRWEAPSNAAQLLPARQQTNSAISISTTHPRPACIVSAGIRAFHSRPSLFDPASKCPLCQLLIGQTSPCTVPFQVLLVA